ncbi:MAG TPA: DEAD/DEAH box helicase, partial [Gammaproteobacteria bacterium]
MITSTDIFRNDGPLSRNLDDYVHRDEQKALAIKIEEAINNEVSLVCEAGTGTGKTYAYLVPAILSGKKAIISTGTKHLQDQLYQKDLPIINRSLGAAVNTALLKGRNNYLCKLR